MGNLLSEKKKSKNISIPEAKEILDKINLENADQIQKRALDYVSKFQKIDAERAKKIRKQLEKECKLSEEEAIELVNIIPKSKEEIRVFAAGWKKLLSTETVEKILQIMKQ